MFRQWSSEGISGGGDELPVIKKEIEGAQRKKYLPKNLQAPCLSLRSLFSCGANTETSATLLRTQRGLIIKKWYSYWLPGVDTRVEGSLGVLCFFPPINRAYRFVFFSGLCSASGFEDRFWIFYRLFSQKISTSAGFADKGPPQVDNTRAQLSERRRTEQNASNVLSLNLRRGRMNARVFPHQIPPYILTWEYDT